MSLLERYLNGETLRVYDEIAILGDKAFSDEYLIDIENVMTETFNRVAFNLEIICSELKAMGYTFWKDRRGDDESFRRPSPNVDKMLEGLEGTLSPVGFLPHSLKFFYKIVGSCNLAWNYQDNSSIYWEMADPMQIAPLQQLLEELTDPDWLEMAEETLEGSEHPVIELAADSLHKDNVSGGPPYGIEIKQTPCIDSRFIDGITDANFIEYLRTCFEYAGFPGFAREEAPESFIKFRRKVTPQLRPI
jgi:hypothetical protein